MSENKNPNRHEPWELDQMQSLPLDLKIRMSLTRLRIFFEKFENEVYVSFSGGKDSTVLADMVAKYCSECGHNKLTLCFSDTGLEYPEIRKFVPQFAKYLELKYNIEIELVTVSPEMNFKEVILKVGYPIGSKKIARMIRDCQNPTENNKATVNLYMTGIKRDGTITKSFKLSKRWIPMIDSKFKVSDQCCEIMKKKPIKIYQKESGKMPILGTMACESSARRQAWLQNGCNSFDSKDPKSQPMSFWTEQDVLNYLKIYQIPYASVYGDIIEVDEQLTTSGCKRTGCMFCMFGCHLEKKPNRFQQMQETHPKLYEYCMKPLEENGLGLDEILKFNNIPH